MIKPLPLEPSFGATTRTANEPYLAYGECGSQVGKPKIGQEAAEFLALPGARQLVDEA